MIIFFQAIFIAIIMLHQNNILVSLIPYPSPTFLVVGIPLFLLGLMKTNLFLRKTPPHAFTALAVILIVRLWTNMQTGEQLATIYVSTLGYVMLTILCVAIISQWSQEQERYAMKLFVVIASVMALLGVTASLIVNLTWINDGIIDPAHLIDISEFSGGKMSRMSLKSSVVVFNQYGISQNIYSFPYSLGLVLTNSYLYDLGGIPFFRASGLFHEPVSTWFMTIPAIVLLASDKLFSKSVTRVLMTVHILFLIAAFSVSIILSLILIFVLFYTLPLLRYKFRSSHALKAFMLVAIVGVGFWIIYVLSGDYTNDYSVGLNVVLSKISGNDYVAIMMKNLNLKSLLFYLYIFGAAILCARAAEKNKDKLCMAFSLIVICFAIVTLKGNQYKLFVSPGFYILFFLMLRHHNKRFFFFSRRAVP